MFPELLDGRVKTLHPMVHGGILNQRGNPDHIRQCEANGIQPIDIVAVNLYAFENTVKQKDCTFVDAIENIDIGGPTLLRAAAKNFNDVTVVVDPEEYPLVLSEIQKQGNTTLATRFYLAKKVFALTAKYDSAISQWMERVDPTSETAISGRK